MCTHRPSCPAADSPEARVVTAHVVTAHPEQGWSLLCDGTIVFDDTGELRPDGLVVGPRRVPGGHLVMAA
ncbi:Amidohydrolase OS=Streptomyces tendae OX=1932 GN=GUR47_32060 PE=4 SV=1 [Streptomyces tendae]